MNFRKIEIEDKPLFDRLLAQSPYVDCEYLFSTLFMWQDVLGYECAAEEDAVYIRHSVHGQLLYHVPLCAPEQIPARVERLMEKEKEKLQLFCVTEEQLRQMGTALTARFTAEPYRDFADYLYHGEDLRLLAGKKFHQKRNHVRKFLNSYSWDFRLFTEAGRELLECAEVLLQWDVRKLESASAHERHLVGNEQKALERCLRYFDRMGLIGGVLYIDGIPKGFTVGEQTNRGGICTGIVHYEKCDSSYDGIYQAINQLFAQKALPEAEYINREDDMGVEGLRKSKLSYHPARLVDKYILKEI